MSAAMTRAHRGEYPPDWREIARRVKDAAGWRCVRCHHPFSDRGAPKACDELCDDRRCPVIRAGKRLNYGCHHLDGDKSNCAWWNCLALDNSCHLSIQARVIPERPWLWSHSEWARVYVAGFYASYYAGQSISREEVEADVDRWLAVGQPWLYGVVT